MPGLHHWIVNSSPEPFWCGHEHNVSAVCFEEEAVWTINGSVLLI